MDKHFFKPLLPDFASGVNIPLSFFSKYMDEGPQNKKLLLTSAVSDTKWSVELAGRRLAKGWTEFASAHAYQVGDILVFQYLGDQVFKVTGFGIKSQCELEYDTAMDANKTATLRVTNDTLKRSRMFLPKEFTTCNGLAQAAGETIYLMNEDGAKWPVKLVMECGDSRERLRLTGGLSEFLRANNFKANNTILIQVLWENENDLVLKVV